MSGWPMVKLGEVISNVSRTEYFSNPDEETFVTVKMHGKGVVTRNIGDGKTPKPFRGFRVASGQFIYSRIDARNGAFGIIPPHLDEAIVSKDFPVYEVDDGKILSNVLLTICTSDAFVDKIRSLSDGATNRQRIKEATLENLQIPLPPLNEQKRIAEILGGVQQSIDTVQRLRVETQNLKIASLNRALDGAFENCQPLSEVSSVQSGITKGRKVKDDSTLISVPYMAVSNVKAGYLDLSTIKEIDATEAELNRFKLEDGDILLTEGGDPDKLGRGTIWRGEVPQAIHQNHIFRVRINEASVLTSEALMAVLEARESKTYFLRSAKQTTGISSINKTQLSATPIPLLEESKVEEITDLWRRTEHVISLYHQKLTLLQELQRSLSARAFAGQL